MISNQLNWAKYERMSLGKYKLSGLSWMFRCSKIFWNLLLQASIEVILAKYSIKEGILVGDDSDKKRSKTTKRIYKVHKVYDKDSGGCYQGQTIVFLLLVTEKVTIPVGFDFYMPDPAISKWNKEDKKLRKKGIKKAYRPKKPIAGADYPSKQEIVQKLIGSFRKNHSQVKVKSVLVDSFYSNKNFLNRASEQCENAQVISQLRNNQLVSFRGKKLSLESYFKMYLGHKETIQIRGKEQEIIVSSARLYVCSHEIKRFIVAVRYPENKNFRYLVATDLSWRTKDIITGYSYRWLIEVFIEDNKLYNGFGQSAKQFDEEGSRRHLILSLLLDHCLLLHPQQVTRLENKLPACTAGSLIQHIKIKSLLHFIQTLVQSGNFESSITRIYSSLSEFYPLADSSKHMNYCSFPDLEPAPGCLHRARSCLSS